MSHFVPNFPEIALIFARARNGVIGFEGRMPWHLPEDLAHFRELTRGAPVLMGRKTWDSLPTRYRPLPGRRNIVITRSATWAEPGAERAESLHSALALCAQSPRVWVIGGAQIYAQALPLAARVEVTEIELDTAGDAFAPELGADWEATPQDKLVAASGLQYQFVSYTPKQVPAAG